MLIELIDTWEAICGFMQGLAMVLVAFIKPFLKPPLIIFPILGVLGLLAKRRI